MNPASQTLSTVLCDLDRTARVGMKFAAVLLSVVATISRAFYQKDDEEEIPGEDTEVVVTLLGPLAQLILDQFARVSVRNTCERWNCTLDAIPGHSQATKTSFRDIPVTGQVLFAGQFSNRPREESERRKVMREADLLSATRGRGQQRRPPQPAGTEATPPKPERGFRGRRSAPNTPSS